jgi:hypothetical protein
MTPTHQHIYHTKERPANDTHHHARDGIHGKIKPLLQGYKQNNRPSHPRQASQYTANAISPLFANNRNQSHHRGHYEEFYVE